MAAAQAEGVPDFTALQELVEAVDDGVPPGTRALN
jgi:hypothetical protein